MVFSPQEISSINEQDMQREASSRQQLIAIIARQDQISGLSKSWRALTDNEQVISAVFSNREDAETWLVQQRAQLDSYLSVF
jgi:hypothetical protein